MTTNVERISSAPSSLNPSSSNGGSAGQPDFASPASPLADPPADYRLVIEPDGTTGGFVYKTLDRATGEVVKQFPREEVLRLRDSPGYIAGQVFTTEA